jgi:hypothetical protein
MSAIDNFFIGSKEENSFGRYDMKLNLKWQVSQPETYSRALTDSMCETVKGWPAQLPSFENAPDGALVVKLQSSIQSGVNGRSACMKAGFTWGPSVQSLEMWEQTTTYLRNRALYNYEVFRGWSEVLNYILLIWAYFVCTYRRIVDVYGQVMITHFTLTVRLTNPGNEFWFYKLHSLLGALN